MDSAQALMVPDVAARAIVRVAKFPASYQVQTATVAAATEIAFWVAPQACDVSAAYFVASTTVTPAAGSNTQTLTVSKYDGAGGAGTTVGTCAIANATPATQYQKLSMALGVTAMSAGEVLTFKSAVAGTATLPTGIVVVEAVLR